jgi:hypothetical protein
VGDRVPLQRLPPPAVRGQHPHGLGLLRALLPPRAREPPAHRPLLDLPVRDHGRFRGDPGLRFLLLFVFLPSLVVRKGERERASYWTFLYGITGVFEEIQL